MEELMKVEDLQKEVSPVISQANEIIVSSPEQYGFAADFLKTVKTAQKKVDENMIEPFRDAKRKLTEKMSHFDNLLMQPLKKAELTIKSKLKIFDKEEEDKRLAEQRRLQAKADEEARRERERLMKQAEKLKTPELKEQRMEEAKEVEAPQITVQTEVPKVSGQHYRKTWKAQIIDKITFIEAALKNPALIAFVVINQTELNKYASATKGEIELPGIRFYEEKTLASGGI